MATSHFTGPSAPRANSFPAQINTAAQPRGQVVQFPAGAFVPGAHSLLSKEHHKQPSNDFVAGKALQCLPLPEAATKWLEWHQASVSQNTVQYYLGQFQALDRFFGRIPLRDIGAAHFRQYQAQRFVNAGELWARKAGPSVINHELNTLQQVLRHAELWAPIANFYKPLPLPRWTPPRVMTPEEAERLDVTASLNPGWELAHIAVTISQNTSASGCELRGLQLKHVDMYGDTEPKVFIPSEVVKNEYRARVIPLNSFAAPAMGRALERARSLGSIDSEHYLFPFRTKRNHYDPTRPASRYWIRAQFEQLRVAAGLPWLRPHDLRHQAITELLEQGVPEQTVMAIAGHVSKQMMDHYSHIRMGSKVSAVQALERGRATKPNASRRVGW